MIPYIPIQPLADQYASRLDAVYAEHRTLSRWMRTVLVAADAHRLTITRDQYIALQCLVECVLCDLEADRATRGPHAL